MAVVTPEDIAPLTTLLSGFRAHRLRLTVIARDQIDLGPNPGSALRGALYGALAGQFCAARGSGLRHQQDHAVACPVCWLLAYEDETSDRGRDRPRPLSIAPPLGRNRFQPTESWSFAVTVFGVAEDAIPYLCQAVNQFAVIGVGQGRGRARLVGIDAENPLTGEVEALLADGIIQYPRRPLTLTSLLAAADRFAGDRVAIDFLTPMRLIDHGTLLRRPELVALVARAVERVESLMRHYGPRAIPEAATWRSARFALMDLATQATCEVERIEWVDLWSGSRRTGRVTPTGGFVGTTVWRGVHRALLPWLLAGQIVHVGKNAVKGDGWLRLRPAIGR